MLILGLRREDRVIIRTPDGKYVGEIEYIGYDSQRHQARLGFTVNQDVIIINREKIDQQKYPHEYE